MVLAVPFLISGSENYGYVYLALEFILSVAIC